MNDPAHDHAPQEQSLLQLTTLADLGVTVHRGPTWAEDDIQDVLGGGWVNWQDGPDAERERGAVAIQVAANELFHDIAQSLPAGLQLVDDHVWGPADTDLAALARDAIRWKERAGFAEIVAATGLWRPPDLATAPAVRIEGRRDRTDAESGTVVSISAARAEAEYWGVYSIGTDGLATWTADFADLDLARRHVVRWERPGSLVCADHVEELPITEQTSPSPGTSAVPKPVADQSDAIGTHLETGPTFAAHAARSGLPRTPSSVRRANPPQPDTDAFGDEFRRLWKATVTTLTAAVRLTHPTTGPVDISDFLASALASVVANVGSLDRLIAGRPGSWESAILTQLASGSVGIDPTIEELAPWRTEPVVVRLNVAQLVAESRLDAAPVDREGMLLDFDDAVAALPDPWADGREPTDEEVARWEAAQDALRHRYAEAFAAYAERFTAAALDVAHAMHLTVPVDVQASTDPEATWWHPEDIRNPQEWDEQDLLPGRLWSAARDRVGLPALDESVEAASSGAPGMALGPPAVTWLDMDPTAAGSSFDGPGQKDGPPATR